MARYGPDLARPAIGVRTDIDRPAALHRAAVT
jgi:hypothetical protein